MKRMRLKEGMTLLIVICFNLVGTASALSEGIKAPYVGGQEMRCEQGNADDPSNTQWNQNPTHTSTSTMAYAWDFNWDTGDNDTGMPVVSSANGEIVVAGTQSGWGKTVVIQFESGNTYRYGRVAHLDRIYVVAGQKVKQGQVVGLLGRTGYNQDGAHLHYQTQNTAASASVFSKFEDIGRPLEDQLYTSGNSNVIDHRESTSHNGQLIANVFGPRAGSIRWYRNPPASPIAGEIISTGDGKGMSKNVYVQHYDKEICGTDSNANYYGSIVYDALGGARSAYVVGWQQRCGWIGSDKIRRGGWELSGGPDSASLRNPISNSYWYLRGTLDYPNGCWRQDFQMSWLCYEKRYGYDKDDRGNTLNSVAPGVYDPWGRIFSDVRRWDAATSYAFAEAYERNGAAVNLGSTYDDGGTVFVHNWIINSSTILIQNFSGGSFGSSAIIYNPSNGNAYNVRTGFWEYYKNNSGPSILGPPKEDEHGNNATQLCNYIACQKFEKGELYWNGNSVVAYIPDPNASGGYGTIGIPSPDPIAPAAPGGLKIQ